MKKSKQPYAFHHLLSSLLMLLALAWLTVCLPYVNESQQAFKQQIEKSSKETKQDNSNPLTNTTEEKTESGTSLLSEYLHDPHQMEHNFISITTFYKCHPSDVYIAYHPDLIIPPPKI